MTPKKKKELLAFLEETYSSWNRPEFIDPDPLEFLAEHPDPRDAEIAAFLASGLAYGRVGRILISVRDVLQRMNNAPREFLMQTPECDFEKIFAGFRHRFTSGTDVARLLLGFRAMIRESGSLENAFSEAEGKDDETVVSACQKFAVRACRFCPDGKSFLLPNPADGSACKRFFLCLRWLVRKDAVDPGCWNKISPARLVVPLDTHMFRISKKLGLTKRSAPDLRAALEITANYRILSPGDPVRYDFALTRFGIHPEIKKESGKLPSFSK